MCSIVGLVALSLGSIGPPGLAVAASGAALEAAAKVEWHWGVKIPLRDGVELSATAYLPAGQGPRP
jgi:predicted acyl esterase